MTLSELATMVTEAGLPKSIIEVDYYGEVIIKTGWIIDEDGHLAEKETG